MARHKRCQRGNQSQADERRVQQASRMGRQMVMDKRTVNSAHERIDELSERVIKLEVMTEEVLTRLRRLESILIGSAGAIILLLIASMYTG